MWCRTMEHVGIICNWLIARCGGANPLGMAASRYIGLDATMCDWIGEHNCLWRFLSGMAAQGTKHAPKSVLIIQSLLMQKIKKRNQNYWVKMKQHKFAYCCVVVWSEMKQVRSTDIIMSIAKLLLPPLHVCSLAALVCNKHLTKQTQCWKNGM